MSLFVNRRDLDFYLYEFLELNALFSTSRYSEYDRDTITAILDAAEALAEAEFLPHAAKLDTHEPEFVDGKVVVIPEVKHALDAFIESGFMSAGFDQDVGGMQLPWLVYQALSGMFTCANTAMSGYAFLTAANANMLNICGSEELKAIYLKPMLEGRWFGTMCLSETQAGSSLGDIRTKAEKQEDGRYKITGSKMWISGGDQNITENIVHMVLAKIPGGPPGVRGISLFLVPKIRVENDGSLGVPNNVVTAGLNHKMGHRGTTNCLLNFGEAGDCFGYLVGKENEGLANMFHMMNEARIGVGLGAVMSGLGGYLYSLGYARERTQGRLPGEKNPETPQVRLIEHADVRRLLMTQKAFVEGGQALIYYCASLIDRQKTSEDKAEIQQLGLLLELLTPVAKSWPSEFCLEANKHAIQVLGGYGYTREYPVERFYRDNRLNPIHEGAHGIHGLDILGRKVRMLDGAAVDVLFQNMNETIESASEFEKLRPFLHELQDAMGLIRKTIKTVIECNDAQQSLANATIFLDAFGHVVVAWLWLQQALVASRAQHSDIDSDFYLGKITACEFFFVYELPKATVQLELVGKLDRTCLDASESCFIGQ